MNDKKTTLAGIGAILTAVGGIIASWPSVDWATAVAAVLAELGHDALKHPSPSSPWRR